MSLDNVRDLVLEPAHLQPRGPDDIVLSTLLFTRDFSVAQLITTEASVTTDEHTMLRLQAAGAGEMRYAQNAFLVCDGFG